VESIITYLGLAGGRARDEEDPDAVRRGCAVLPAQYSRFMIRAGSASRTCIRAAEAATFARAAISAVRETPPRTGGP
jgi:hypothetical protein